MFIHKKEQTSDFEGYKKNLVTLIIYKKSRNQPKKQRKIGIFLAL
jgi:hypothetical protein